MDPDELDPLDDLDLDTEDTPPEEPDDAADDTPDLDSPADEPAAPKESRAARDIAAQRARAREAEERAERLEQELQAARAQAAQPRETPQEREYRLSLMTPEERIEATMNERFAALEARNQQLERNAIEREDRSAFSALCAAKPVVAKIKDEVEAKVAELRKTGASAPRSVIAAYILGEKLLAKGDAAAKKHKAAADGRRNEQKAAPSGSRGDTSGSKPAANEREARRARLENMRI